MNKVPIGVFAICNPSLQIHSCHGLNSLRQYLLFYNQNQRPPTSLQLKVSVPVAEYKEYAYIWLVHENECFKTQPNVNDIEAKAHHSNKEGVVRPNPA